MSKIKNQNIATIYLTDEERKIWDYISENKVKIGFRSMSKLMYFCLISHPAISNILKKGRAAKRIK